MQYKYATIMTESLMIEQENDFENSKYHFCKHWSLNNGLQCYQVHTNI